MSSNQKQPLQIMVDPKGTPGEYGDHSTSDSKCPRCGARAEGGFGLAYGGYGPYEFCEKQCGWYWKRIMEDDES